MRPDVCPTAIGLCSSLCLFALLSLLTPEISQAQVVRGTVLESGTDRPVGTARIVLLDTEGVVLVTTESGLDGKFTLEAPGPGAYLLGASRIGYREKIDGILDLGEDGLLEISFFLVPEPLELEGIIAEAERMRTEEYLEYQGFYRRQQAHPGQFLDTEEIRARKHFDTMDLLDAIPFVHRRDGFGEGSQVEMMGRGTQGRCRPKVFVDGIPQMGTFDLNSYVIPDEVLAVEVYRGIAQIPMEWGAWQSCGVILIWSQWGALMHRGSWRRD